MNFQSKDMFAVFSRDHAITCKWNDGTLSIVTVGHLLDRNNKQPSKTMRDLCLDIIKECPGPIHEVIQPQFNSNIAQEVYQYMKRFKDGYEAVVGGLLNPQTYLGKKRLYSEFELLIE